MTKLRDELHKEIDDLKRIRDELKVQAHLAKAEAKEIWQQLEATWPELKKNLAKIESLASESIDEVASATRTLIDSLRKGYERFRREHHPR